MTAAGLRTWGEQDAGLWVALAASGRAVEVAVAGRGADRLRGAGRVIDGWTRAKSAEDPAAELESLRKDVAALDPAPLEACGALDGAVKRLAALEAAAAAVAAGRPALAISSGRVWYSERVPS